MAIKNYYRTLILLAGLGVLWSIRAGLADTKTWCGLGANGNATTEANWTEGALMQGDDIVLNDTTNKNLLWNTNLTVSSWTQIGYAGTVTVATVYSGTFTNLSITGHCIISNGTWTHTVNGATETYRLSVSVGGDLIVGPAAKIDVSWKGYQAGAGPSYARGTGDPNLQAPSHGGQGSVGSGALPLNKTYGSLVAPINLGCGAFDNNTGDSHGGGAVLMTVLGTTTLDGQMLAQGGPRNGSNSGAGGSIYLTTGRLFGTGAIKALGGLGNTGTTGGGGGGRIAVMINNGAGSFADFTGTISAAGFGARPGGAGTIYLRAPGQASDQGTLIVAGATSASPSGTEITQYVTDTSVGNVFIRSNATFKLDVDQTLTLSGIWSNGAAFSATTGASVVFAGAGESTIISNTAFVRLTCTTPDKTLRFAAGSSNSVSEQLTLTGAEDHRLLLRSTVDGSPWKLNLKATAGQTVEWVDVQDSDALSGLAISAVNSVDSGNNSNWVFTTTGVTNTWTGASNTTWSLAANWDLGYAPTLSDGMAVIPGGCPNYPALDADNSVNAFSLAPGTTLNLNGFNLTILKDATLAGTVSNVFTEQLIFAGNTTQRIDTAGQTLGNLRVSNTGGPVIFSNGCTATELVLTPDLNPMTVLFQSGSSFTLDALIVKGNATTNVTLAATTPGSRWNLQINALARVSGATVQDCDASAGKPVYPFNSQDNGNNTNWIFTEVWKTWTGSASPAFTTAANWNPAGVPDSSTRILIETNTPYALVIGTPATVKSMLINDAGAARVTNSLFTVLEDLGIRSGALTIDCPMTVSGDVYIVSGATLTHTANGSTEAYKLDLSVGGNLTIFKNSSIDASYRGFYNGGPGKAVVGANVWGASYGGRGVYTVAPGAPTYGSILSPIHLGSSGPGVAGYGEEHGGGAIRLRVSGTTALTGSIVAQAGPRDGFKCPSGGSVFLTTGRLTGAGDIKAQGGPSSSGQGGGGGRIAVVLTDPAARASDFAGTLSASGLGTYGGGAGTVYWQAGNQATGRGDVIIDNNGQGASAATGVTVLPANTNAVTDELRYARLLITNSTSRVLLSADLKVSDIFIYPGATLNLSNFNLYVYDYARHDLGGGTTNSTGGRILWLLEFGTVYSIR